MPRTVCCVHARANRRTARTARSLSLHELAKSFDDEFKSLAHLKKLRDNQNSRFFFFRKFSSANKTTYITETAILTRIRLDSWFHFTACSLEVIFNRNNTRKHVSSSESTDFGKFDFYAIISCNKFVRRDNTVLFSLVHFIHKI